LQTLGLPGNARGEKVMAAAAGTNTQTASSTNAFRFAVAALAVSAVGTVGSLYLSLGMGLKACPLCFYQRTFMMSTAAVLHCCACCASP
jgi:disulfide bond formation protein DsbB